MSDSESAYLEHYSVHDYPVPLTTVDVCIFTIRNERLEVLVTRRNRPPHRGRWALPGGFLDLEADGDLLAAASRKLVEKTGFSSPYLEQVGTVGNALRDPRGWSVTVVYLALVPHAELNAATNGRSDLDWYAVEVENRPLAFDHAELIGLCLDRLRSKSQYTSLPLNFLSGEFTLSELQQVFEIVMGCVVDKKAFRRRILAAELVKPTPRYRRGPSRPARLYKVNKRRKNHVFDRMMGS